MPEEIIPDVFRIKIPLPGLELEHLNSYLILGENRKILIDIGMNKGSFDKLSEELRQVDLSVSDLTDVLITHFHVDHAGLISSFKTAGSKDLRVFINSKELEILKNIQSDPDKYFRSQLKFGSDNGIPDEIIRDLEGIFSGFKDIFSHERVFESVKSLGEEIVTSQHKLEVLSTPGHSPGHTCFYEPVSEILFAGDHLLRTTTPNVTQTGEDEEPLADFLKSLEKIEDLNVSLVLPGHGDPFENYLSRVAELMNHYRERLKETESALREDGLTAYEVASKLNWDVDYSSWEEFPSFQKWLATGETIAHLKYLENRERIKRISKNGVLKYQAKN